MNAPDVSIVIATYNRPDALRAAIQSVYAQSYQNWQVLIIGDSCDLRTLAVVEEFDARTRYINLPSSCGEQAIPNSVGMSLARSDVIALLNHDDLWLPDHLSIAIAALNQGAEVFHGRSSLAREVKLGADGSAVPVFSSMSAIHFNYGDALRVADFEPASAMVFKRSVFERVGRWRAAREIYRFPFTDWLLRIWRSGAKVVFGTEISVLKLETYWQARPQISQDKNAAGVYTQPCPEHAYILQQMRQFGSGFRAALHQEINALPTQIPFRPHFLRRWADALSKFTYWHTQMDLPLWRARLFKNAQRGEYLKHMSLRRTGRELPALPDFDALLEFAKRQLNETEVTNSHNKQSSLKQAHAHAS